MSMFLDISKLRNVNGLIDEYKFWNVYVCNMSNMIVV